MASNLSQVGLDVTLITDSAIFSIISRVNKVIIGTKAIFASGGYFKLLSIFPFFRKIIFFSLKAQIGTHALCLAAKHHNIPVIVCTALFKLSPDYFNDSNNVSEYS